MKRLFLILALLPFLFGCRTFTNTELEARDKSLIRYGYQEGFLEGKQVGFDLGRIIGSIDCITGEMND